ncbi:indole-3-glycerol phosphate synthase TrpC [Flavobacterium sedimenticola]|uniref:Indole-3-glycerol phosphate synthase n=1 Tax=Flavobacterium sedimenticola TaxID=3043286 RepID=A0ABT6XPX1_9FLAO|nr:indole-3-glycerol phosphate synthase TrpC [Flavobacterium sedimenticola]MDI9257141.1 indole-3-glycerol phosphate synthase TrpC [Flavobacterium sedimenticola]
MNILDQIIAHKKREIALKKSVVSANQLENSELFNSQTTSLSKSVLHSPFGIIAEHKRRSPSKATINHNLSLENVVKGYEEAGASGISVLTDTKFFGGSSDDLLLAKACVKTPVLRKEFIIDEYQIIESKAYGADAILLIAAVLTQSQIKSLTAFAHSIALEVLLEVHNQAELNKSLIPELDMIGVNNRNLKTFEMNLDTSLALADKIPNDVVKISESGLNAAEQVKLLKSAGFNGFLMGETFMKADNPGVELETLLQLLKTI